MIRAGSELKREKKNDSHFLVGVSIWMLTELEKGTFMISALKKFPWSGSRNRVAFRDLKQGFWNQSAWVYIQTPLFTMSPSTC